MKNKLIPVAALILTMGLTGCSKDENRKEETPGACGSQNPYLNKDLDYGCVTDVEGNGYATIQIGEQVWMAENLRTAKYNDGQAIPNVPDNNAWGELESGAYSVHGNSAENGKLYGKLYNWAAVSTGKLCPVGWHIPSAAEWQRLESHLGSNGGRKLKATGNLEDGTGLWKKHLSAEGTNESGFSALPAGSRFQSGFNNLNQFALWWTSTIWDVTGSVSYNLVFANPNVDHLNLRNSKGIGFSCRCIKD